MALAKDFEFLNGETAKPGDIFVCGGCGRGFVSNAYGYMDYRLTIEENYQPRTALNTEVAQQ